MVESSSTSEHLLSLLKLVMSLKLPFEEMKSISSGMTLLEACKKHGNWAMYETINLSTMGDSLQSMVLKERNRIEQLKATACTFLNVKLCQLNTEERKCDEMMESICEFLEIAFEKHLPISEDILYMAETTNLTNNP